MTTKIILGTKTPAQLAAVTNPTTGDSYYVTLDESMPNLVYTYSGRRVFSMDSATNILGWYADETALTTAHPAATTPQGATYIVGAASPYTMKICNGTDAYTDGETTTKKVLSNYGSLDLLNAGVPSPAIGAYYSVGSAAPYVLYVAVYEWLPDTRYFTKSDIYNLRFINSTDNICLGIRKKQMKLGQIELYTPA